jgi:endonuclease/exonuclease/phosphatase family metal-dependent hydrolase
VADGVEQSATLDVLTYNIEGLPPPARSGRPVQLRRIGEILRELREKGEAPDVVLFQEAFSGAATKAVVATGYPAIAPGPSRTQSGPLRTSEVLPGKAKPLKGELGLRFLSSGIVIASRYPIILAKSAPYSRRSCAGIDCLANKGVVLAAIAMPGLPEPIQILNTHMNSQGASRVLPARHLAAHKAQTRELSQFMTRYLDRSRPVIFGGDFNMRRAPERFDLFMHSEPLTLVHQYCLDGAHGCEVKMSWDGDEPWMDTQDLQLFLSSPKVEIRPIRVEAMFDGSEGNPVLSDHDGFRVTYRLRWKADQAAAAGLCSAGAAGEGMSRR